MSISELSILYYKVQNAFDAVRSGEVEMSAATALQSLFESSLAQFQLDNPDRPIIIDSISRSVLFKDDLPSNFTV